jgi:hypothetical protein
MTPIAPQPAGSTGWLTAARDRVVAIVSCRQVLDRFDLGTMMKTATVCRHGSINPINGLRRLFEGTSEALRLALRRPRSSLRERE